MFGTPSPLKKGLHQINLGHDLIQLPGVCIVREREKKGREGEREGERERERERVRESLELSGKLLVPISTKPISSGVDRRR